MFLRREMTVVLAKLLQSHKAVIFPQCIVSFRNKVTQHVPQEQIWAQRRCIVLFHLSCSHFIHILSLLFFLYCFSAEMMTSVRFGWKQSQERCSPFFSIMSSFVQALRVPSLNIHPLYLQKLCRGQSAFTQPACMCHYNSVIWRGQQKSSHQCQAEIQIQDG